MTSPHSLIERGPDRPVHLVHATGTHCCATPCTQLEHADVEMFKVLRPQGVKPVAADAWDQVHVDRRAVALIGAPFVFHVSCTSLADPQRTPHRPATRRSPSRRQQTRLLVGVDRVGPTPTAAANSATRRPLTVVVVASIPRQLWRQTLIADARRSATSRGISTASGTAPRRRPPRMVPMIDPVAMASTKLLLARRIAKLRSRL
jgi:hypothetical protein